MAAMAALGVRSASLAFARRTKSRSKPEKGEVTEGYSG